jgi:phosphoglycerate dehydrogenase-like enzyme
MWWAGYHRRESINIRQAMASDLTIWCNADLNAAARGELEDGCAGQRLLIAERPIPNLGAVVPSESLQEADIAFGQPSPEQVIENKKLRWMHITSAGYTRYDRADFKAALAARGAQFTNSSSVFNEPCAQHLLAFMLAQARQLPYAFADQRENRSWIFDQIRARSRVLENETVLILGYGAIAHRLVELLAPFSLNVIAVRQRVRGDENVPTYPNGELDQLLPGADHIVSTLPASDSTYQMMSAHRFTLAKPGAVFYNIGRGTTVDQNALIQSLESGYLAAAYLDVTDPEPLPSDHPLWKAQNCWITPHTGGGRQDEHVHLVRHFLSNLSHFVAGEPLLDRVF